MGPNLLPLLGGMNTCLTNFVLLLTLVDVKQNIFSHTLHRKILVGLCMALYRALPCRAFAGAAGIVGRALKGPNGPLYGPYDGPKGPPQDCRAHVGAL